MQGFDVPDWGSFEPALEKLRGELTKNAFDKRCCSTALRRRTLRHSLRSERSGKLKLDRSTFIVSGRPRYGRSSRLARHACEAGSTFGAIRGTSASGRTTRFALALMSRRRDGSTSIRMAFGNRDKQDFLWKSNATNKVANQIHTHALFHC